MTEFLKMDVFFVVATIGFVALVALIGVGVFYIIRLLRTLNRVADTVEEEAYALKSDIDEVRASVKQKGRSMFSAANFISSLIGNTRKRALVRKRSKS